MDGKMDITRLYGREILGLSTREKETLSDQAFLYWRNAGFPFREFSDNEIKEEIERLKRYNKARLHKTLRKPSVVGLALANSFHPQIWQARVRGKSPIEIFNDDSSFRYVIEKAPGIMPNRRCWNAACIRMLVSLHNRSRVSNFRPTVARAIAESLSKEGGHILDFCAGYGGRYLGISTLRRHYYGIDASRDQIHGLRKMSARLKGFVVGEADFLQAEAETAMKDIESRSFDLVFTSPPYFRLEKYEISPLQSSFKYMSYDLWKDLFLDTVARESLRIVRRGGYIAINISNYGNFALENDFIEICRKYISRRVYRLRMYMSTNPSYKKRTSVYKKWEPIFIIEK